MKTELKVLMAAAVFLLLTSGTPVPGFGQCPCVTLCPAGDNAIAIAPTGGYKTPDLDGSGAVNLVDFSMFAGCWPPRPYCFCADYNCDFLINLIDFATFASHWLHAGPFPAYNQPDTDHYKTYEVLDGPTQVMPMILRDQFEEEYVDVTRLVRVATPASKNNQWMCDSIAHLTWWELIGPIDPEPPRLVNAQDQFGRHELQVTDSRFLLVPALKNQQTGGVLPQKNHYLCYDAIGDPLQISVVLADQFDTTGVVILQPVFFCNPCVKEILQSGDVYPIVDTLAHYIVYRIDNPIPYQIMAHFKDQFGEYDLFLAENWYLCVPALKDGFTLIVPGSE